MIPTIIDIESIVDPLQLRWALASGGPKDTGQSRKKTSLSKL